MPFTDIIDALSGLENPKDGAEKPRTREEVKKEEEELLAKTEDTTTFVQQLEGTAEQKQSRLRELKHKALLLAGLVGTLVFGSKIIERIDAMLIEVKKQIALDEWYRKAKQELRVKYEPRGYGLSFSDNPEEKSTKGLYKTQAVTLVNKAKGNEDTKATVEMRTDNKGPFVVEKDGSAGMRVLGQSFAEELERRLGLTTEGQSTFAIGNGYTRLEQEKANVAIAEGVHIEMGRGGMLTIVFKKKDGFGRPLWNIESGSPSENFDDPPEVRFRVASDLVTDLDHIPGSIDSDQSKHVSNMALMFARYSQPEKTNLYTGYISKETQGIITMSLSEGGGGFMDFKMKRAEKEEEENV